MNINNHNKSMNNDPFISYFASIFSFVLLDMVCRMKTSKMVCHKLIHREHWFVKCVHHFCQVISDCFGNVLFVYLFTLFHAQASNVEPVNIADSMVCVTIWSIQHGKWSRLFDHQLLKTNLKNASSLQINRGATMTPFQRLIGPLYADGINAPRISITGHDLPLSRVVSRTIHPDEGFHDHAGTVMVIAWGQFMDHDFTLTGNHFSSK